MCLGVLCNHLCASQSPKKALWDFCNPPAIETSIFAIRTIATGLWNLGNSETIQTNCYNCTKIALCVHQEQSTDHYPSTIITIQFNYVLIAEVIHDCKVIDRIARWSTGLHQNWSNYNTHEPYHVKANATSDSCRTTVILIKESSCQV